MKKTISLSLLAIVILLTAPALARIGESQSSFSNRYGEPLKVEKSGGGDKTIFYRSGNYDIEAVFRANIAVSMTYSLHGGGAISIRRLEHILHRNGSITRTKNIWYINGVNRNGTAALFSDRAGNNRAAYDFTTKTLTITATGMR